MDGIRVKVPSKSCTRTILVGVTVLLFHLTFTEMPTSKSERPQVNGAKWVAHLEQTYGEEWPYIMVKSFYNIQSWIIASTNHEAVPDHLRQALDIMSVLSDGLDE